MAGTLVLEVSRRPRNDPSGAWSVGGVGLVVRVSRRPQNYPLGAKERSGRAWLCLWGVAWAPSVYRSPMVTLRFPWN